ncbi:MAG: hypothetical protein WC806_04415, partial [Candidatus Gracilibacteria bacterium]
GPVQVGNFGKLDSENYNLLLSYIIEGKIWGAEDPKHILKVFIPAFTSAIMKEEYLSKLASKLYKAVQQKHIVMYSSDYDIEDLFISAGLSGKAYENSKDEDYLSIINYSIGGSKSDQFIEEKINHNTYIDKKGEVIDEVILSRKHAWNDSIYIQWKNILSKYGFTEMPDQIIDILGRGRNETLTKIYVPAGAVLLDSSGGTITQHFDDDVKKEYFLVNLNLKAKEQKEIKIKYRLPYMLNLSSGGSYKLIVEKQPGSRGSIFNKTFSFEDGISLRDIYPKDYGYDENNQILQATNLVYDRYFSALLTK